MLVLVSPAKTLDYESDLNFKDFSIAQHLADSEILIRELQTKNPDDLSSNRRVRLMRSIMREVLISAFPETFRFSWMEISLIR